MVNTYTDKEIIAAINILNSILAVEDFALDVNEYSINENTLTTELNFEVLDMQNNGRLENMVFDNLADVAEETDVYNSLLNSFHNRVGAETIPQDDWDRKVLIFLTSDYCKELLSSITASIYSDYVKTGFGKNKDRLKENEGIDELSLLLDKDNSLSQLKSVKELSKDELAELKQRYYNELHTDVSLDELANINEIVTDKEVYDYYKNVSFVNDDFICNQEENIEEDFEDHNI